MALSEDQLRALLAVPAETTTLDFKRDINWADTRRRLETCRDLVCLANRDGGHLVFGVDDDSGRFTATGLQDDDRAPDGTELNQALARYFAPVPQAEVRTYSIDDRRFVVMSVPRFPDAPHIAVAVGNDSGQKQVIRVNALYRRSDVLSCTEIDAEGLSAIINRGIVNRGAAFARAVDAERSEIEPYAIPTVGGNAGSERAAEFVPLGVMPREESLRRLEDIAAAAVVRAAGGGVRFPRAVDPTRLAPADVVRTTNGIRYEVPVEPDGPNGRGVLALSRHLAAVVRETLWEDQSDARDRPGLDITTMFLFTIGALLFGRRLYGGRVEAFQLRIGLLEPAGRELTLPPRYALNNGYIARSEEPIWVQRTVVIAEMADPDYNLGLLRDTVSEFLDYFGFHLEEPGFLAQTKAAIFGVLMVVPDEFNHSVITA